MKKLFFVFIAMSCMTMEAQNITDAVRYSHSEISGTARFRSMAGAFGALGGDISALSVNPAGSAVFLRSYSSLTLDIGNAKNEVNYFNGFTNNSNNKVDLSQAGAVFVFNNQDESSSWRKFSLGLNYSKTNDFENKYSAVGTNTRSIDQYFLNYANGVPLDLLEPIKDESVADLYSYLGENEGYAAQQALLGYQAYIIDADDPENMDQTSYSSALGKGNFDQNYLYSATGLNGKFSLNFSTQFQDNLYLGLNLNTHFMNYDRVNRFQENNSNSGSTVDLIHFEDRLNTVGSGFSFQLGAITRLGEYLRVGASYESPTWYTISEENTQYLKTDSEEFGAAVVNPGIVNIYPDYKLQTPGKITGSLAVVFGKTGLLSVDYSYKDYSNTKFKPTRDPSFSFENDNIENNLQAASSIGVGGEYKINAFSLRAGYRYQQSPYKDEYTIGNLNRYSAGLGYDFGSIRLDAAYDIANQDLNPQLYQVGLTDVANIKRKESHVSLTLSFGI